VKTEIYLPGREVGLFIGLGSDLGSGLLLALDSGVLTVCNLPYFSRISSMSLS
jgi:hypothetical protein